MKTHKILVYDIETDSQNPEKANLKWFGGYDPKDNKFFIHTFKEIEEIQNILDQYTLFIGFNNKYFDNPILAKLGIIPKGFIIDLLEICSHKTNGIQGKEKLMRLGYKLRNYKLKTIVETLGLDDSGKGEIDYNIFKKDDWSKDEQEEIEKYLKQDLIITSKLFNFVYERYKPLSKYMSDYDNSKLAFLTRTLGSISYSLLCHKSGLKIEWDDNTDLKQEQIIGGHHINPRETIIKGNIIAIDFKSAYPHSLMMANLYSRNCDCCKEEEKFKGDDVFHLKGKYCSKKQGVLETAIKDIFLERIEAQKKGDKQLADMLKLVINSCYGISGNKAFKHLYNSNTANDCTEITRTMLRRMAAILECNGCKVIYGFTDSVYIKIPNWMTKELIEKIVDKTIQAFKKRFPFPADTFTMPIEHEYKFIWFVRLKNCYLWVDKDDQVGYKSTLFPVTAPKLIFKVLEKYINPRIIKQLDINFTEQEILGWVKEFLQEDITLAAEEYSIKHTSEYKLDSQLQNQISKVYGEGTHLLICNKAGIGVGKANRYCSIEDFNKNKLKIDDINFSKTMKWFKPFWDVNQTKLKEYGE
jgi:DNA polymerase elongation subunit (family B)